MTHLQALHISIKFLLPMASDIRRILLKVLGKSVGLCKTTKRKDQLYISLLVSVWRIICENFNPNGPILAEMNENINKGNKENSGFGEALQ